MFTETELDNILSKINLNQFREEVKKKNSKAGRKPVEIWNTYYRQFQEVGEYSDLSPWVDDVLNGAARLSTNGSHTTAAMLFHLLKHMSLYSSGEIKNHINRKRSMLGEHIIQSDSYCRWLVATMNSVIKSLDYHTGKGKKLLREPVDNRDLFILSADTKAWEAHKAACEAQDVPVGTNLDNPLADIPLNDRKLLAGLTVEEIEGKEVPLYSSGEIDLPASMFIKSKDVQIVYKRYTQEQFDCIKKHRCSYHNTRLQDLPEMVDLDTGEITK